MATTEGMMRSGKLKRVPWRGLLATGVVVLALSVGLARGAGAATIPEFPIPTPNSSPQGITAGPDSALWFTEFSGNKIRRITTTGTVTEFALPPVVNWPTGITAGPDGALWFTENANKIWRITTEGAVAEFFLPTGSQPQGITADSARDGLREGC